MGNNDKLIKKKKLVVCFELKNENKIPEFLLQTLTFGMTRESRTSCETSLPSVVRTSPQQQQVEEQQQQLLSADGRTLLNLWLIPHFSQVLHMFHTLSVSVKPAELNVLDFIFS